MHIEEFREYCLHKKGVTEEFPFDDVTMVFKVMGKMFALTSIKEFRINLKSNPEDALEYREKYSSVIPGYHMNKKHWNTVIMDGSIPDKTVKEWVDDSYELIVASLPAKIREELNGL